MLQDYLVRDIEDLEVSSEDWEAVKSVQDTRGVQTVLKVCVGKVMGIESDLFGEAGRSLDLAQMQRLIGAREAYYAIADLIMDPPVEESNDE